MIKSWQICPAVYMYKFIHFQVPHQFTVAKNSTDVSVSGLSVTLLPAWMTYCTTSPIINMADIAGSRSSNNVLLVTKQASKRSWAKWPDRSEEWCLYRLSSSDLSSSVSYKIRLKWTSYLFRCSLSDLESPWTQLEELSANGCRFASLCADPRGKTLKRCVTII